VFIRLPRISQTWETLNLPFEGDNQVALRIGCRDISPYVVLKEKDLSAMRTDTNTETNAGINGDFPQTRLGMGTLLARNWWATVIRGMISILFGLAVFAFPGISLLGLIVLFGIFSIVSGFFALMSLKSLPGNESTWMVLLEGITGIAVGIIALSWSGLTGVVLLYLIATWVIVSGIFEVITAVRLRRQIDNEWLLSLAGVASVIFGILLIAWPTAGAFALLWVIGTYAIFFGVLLVALGLRLRNWKQRELV
jgi:uncharacterized membrane protein HdeD (DUF308 family)